MELKDIGYQIAKKGLEIGAIKLQPSKPFIWASGFQMPIYNDNRRLLADANNRKLVTEGFKEILESEKIPINYIVGTSTAGIAPATSVANLYDVPLIIMKDNVPYIIEKHNETSFDVECDAVASTCPWAIPYGVSIANKKQVPFMYVRQKQKEHGLQQQIEGSPKEGQKVLLVNFYIGDSYLDNAVAALEEKGVEVIETFTHEISDVVKPKIISGKHAPVIEDLISTGGSSAKEVQAARDAGAKSDYCLSIFNYGLDKAVQAFGALEPECNVGSILTYDILMKAVADSGKFTEEQLEMLKEWRADPFGWGEKHGFPKVEK
ncbi:hypothetical protein GOV06_03795 [Candidatus Woesearchaeota archaeon]|nr:hypothetical protein [Candidatus Woesearchaeota archaeon]